MNKIIYSKKFTTILKSINSDISKRILDISAIDDKCQNFIDLTPRKDMVSFTNNGKVKKMLETPDVVKYIVTRNGNLTDNVVNTKVFNKLGLDINSPLRRKAEVNSIGQILAETIRKKSGNTYCLFSTNGFLTVINKNALEKYYSVETIWEDNFVITDDILTVNRETIKIGRLAKSLLNDVSDTDIELFVNQFKATVDLVNDALSKFDIVQGDDIKYWYKGDNYIKGRGSLNNSCMCNVAPNYFDLYSNNSNIKMLILYDDNGVYTDGRYVSDKIKGRALLWNCLIDSVDSNFMDRIYTKDEHDVELFKKWAIENHHWFKKNQTMSPNEIITNGDVEKNAVIDVVLENPATDRLPYMDTLCYITTDSSKCSNNRPSEEVYDKAKTKAHILRIARETNGRWVGYNYEEELDEDDDEDDD